MSAQQQTTGSTSAGLGVLGKKFQMPIFTTRFLLFFAVLLACGQNGTAATAATSPPAVVQQQSGQKTVKKQKKKGKLRHRLAQKFLQKKLAKWGKKGEDGISYGGLGVLLFLGSLVLSIFLDVPLFLLGCLAMLVFSILGLSNDEKKSWAVIGLILTGIIFLGLVLIILQFADG